MIPLMLSTTSSESWAPAMNVALRTPASRMTPMTWCRRYSEVPWGESGKAKTHLIWSYMRGVKTMDGCKFGAYNIEFVRA